MTINNLGAAAAAMVEASAASGRLDDLMGLMAGCFRRWEPRVSAGEYVRGLMSDLPRKNCWTIAEHVGHPTPGRMQHLLADAKWDTMAAMAAVRAFGCEYLDDGDAVAILDESGQEKKGTAIVGVKRQYVGCAGRVSNAVNVVYCSVAAAAGHALVGARLYVPADPGRRRQARVPDDVVFATKPELGRRILADLHVEGRLPGWVPAPARGVRTAQRPAVHSAQARGHDPVRVPRRAADQSRADRRGHSVRRRGARAGRL